MLYLISECIVVAHERIEGTQLHPSNAQLLSSVASEPTDVSSHEGNSEKSKVEHHCQKCCDVRDLSMQCECGGRLYNTWD